MHSLDHIHEEPQSEDQAEQVPVEASTNVVLDQGKPRCITTNTPYFLFGSLIYVLVDCALSS
jgi:hypothetical protein